VIGVGLGKPGVVGVELKKLGAVGAELEKTVASLLGPDIAGGVTKNGCS
jgi:hypothetical protein